MSEKKKKIAVEKRVKLPKKIIPIPCADKETWTEKWYPNRNLLNFPHSWRGVFCGPPSCGKTNLIKNIILRAQPPFEEVIVCHYSSEDTKEWDDVDCEIIKEIPSPHDFSIDNKKLLILEDIDLSSLKKTDLGNLNRLYGYASSHKNLSIALTCQNAFDCPPCARRVSTIFVLFKSADLNALAMLASRTGLKSRDLLDIFKKYILDNHNNLIVDLTVNSPARLRIDGYKVLELTD